MQQNAAAAPALRSLLKEANKNQHRQAEIKKNFHTKELAKQKRESIQDILYSHDNNNGYLQPETSLEKTYKVKQTDILPQLSLRDASKYYSLELNQLGPYIFAPNRNGRVVLLGGRKGHLALLDRANKSLLREFHVKETIRSLCFLQSEAMFAVAQEKYTFIYDKQGIEIHCLKKHLEALALQFLPYHYLLCSVGYTGHLRYQDISTGQLVAEWATHLGPCHVLAQNPAKAILHCGHANGTVTLWSPSSSKEHVKILCHLGAVNAVRVDEAGKYMVSAGMDGKVKIWDLRKLYQSLATYTSYVPTTTISISQKGMVATGAGSHVKIWKDMFSTSKQESPYMAEENPGCDVQDVHFIPYEDVLCLSHDHGFKSILVPGSGEANFDTFEASPFQTHSQRREGDVKKLLDKIQPDMITMDEKSVVGAVKPADEEEQNKEGQKKVTLFRDQLLKAKLNIELGKKKMRGKGTAAKKLKRKQQNVIDLKRLEWQQKIDADKKKKEEAANNNNNNSNNNNQGNLKVLDRFKSKHK